MFDNYRYEVLHISIVRNGKKFSFAVYFYKCFKFNITIKIVKMRSIVIYFVFVVTSLYSIFQFKFITKKCLTKLTCSFFVFNELSLRTIIN